MLLEISLGLTGMTDTSMELFISDISLSRRKPKKSKHVSLQKEREQRERAQRIRTIECDQKLPYCGLSGRVKYEYGPKSTYQVYCRQKPTADLQHFTKCLKPENVDRYVICQGFSGTCFQCMIVSFQSHCKPVLTTEVIA